MKAKSFLLFPALLILAASCVRLNPVPDGGYLRISEGPAETIIESISPYDGHIDSLVLDRPVRHVVCMSSTQVAGLAALGATDLISGVSGLAYLSTQLPDNVFEAGYDAALDYERIVSSRPDLVLGYVTSEAEPEYFQRLRSLGVRVFPVHEHMEQDPLGRAAYLRLYGALSGRMPVADSLLRAVRTGYESLREEIRQTGSAPVRVLLNTPYSDAWYVPNRGSYMTRLIEDAGGEVLGSGEGTGSSILSLEEIFTLAPAAQKWLNVTGVEDLEDLHSQVRLSDRFAFAEGDVFALKAGQGGGLDFYESGAVRPDLVLRDLALILSGMPDSLKYYYTLPGKAPRR